MLGDCLRVFLPKMKGEMLDGQLVVYCFESPTEVNLQNYPLGAFKAMANADAKFTAKGMPVATFETGIMQRTATTEFNTT